MLAEYLATAQAREDVRHMLSCGLPSTELFPASSAHIAEFEAGAWIRMQVTVGTATPRSVSAYYRPDGDRYVVTDLGEGFRAACLRGFDRCEREHMQQLAELAQTFPSDFDEEAPLGWLELRKVEAKDLPDALCRVMLASLRVAEVQS